MINFEPQKFEPKFFFLNFRNFRVTFERKKTEKSTFESNFIKKCETVFSPLFYEFLENCNQCTKVLLKIFL